MEHQLTHQGIIQASSGTFADALRVASGGIVGDGVKVTSIYDDTTQDMNMVYDSYHILMQMRMDMLRYPNGQCCCRK